MASMNTREENKALVISFVEEVWNAKNFDKVVNFVAPDYVQHNPNLPNGRIALEVFLRGFYAANMAKGEFKIARLIADDDIVVAHSLFRLTPEDRGTAVVDVYRVRDGQLVEHWDVKEPLPERSMNGNPVV